MVGANNTEVYLTMMWIRTFGRLRNESLLTTSLVPLHKAVVAAQKVQPMSDHRPSQRLTEGIISLLPNHPELGLFRQAMLL